MSSELDRINGEVLTKRGKLHDLITSKPDGNFTTEELASIKGINDELTPLVERQKQLSGIKKIQDETAAFMDGQNPVGEKLPGGGERTVKGIKLTNGDFLDLRDEKGNMLPDSKIAEQLQEIATKSFDNARVRSYEGGLGTPVTATEISEAFVKSQAFLQYNAAEKRSPAAKDIEIKTLLNTTGFPVASVRSDLLLQFPLRRLVIADLFPSGNITQPAFVYMEETTATNGAAATAESGQKPESALAFTERSAPVRKIATVLPVTDELFQDAPAMRSYVQGRLTVFLQLAEENELLNGSDTIIDCIYKGLTKVEVNAFLPPSGIVLHPNDWLRIRLSKDANGNYLFGSPLQGDVERVFGYPVVKTTALDEGTGLVGAFDLAAQIFRRTGIAFAVSTEHADFFIKNQLMLRVEERLAFPVFRPAGFCELTGLNG